ncbi:hypothetical protein [Thiohalophilus sp.]|uniref:hypothetical protein n=1 Tax=Thiohalophilus sp. TaxID=3028392 RepID=UPI0039766E4F
MQLADIMIHVNETLPAAERGALEDQLRQVEGVIAPRFSEDKPHLLLVSYDADVADTARLLGQVESSGYSAQLVGM